MCNKTHTHTLTLRKRSSSSAPDLQKHSSSISETPRKRLQPYNVKNPIGNFTAKTTSPEQILNKHASIDARKNLVAQVGLENFIRSVVQPLNLNLPDKVLFNMNGQGLMNSWEDVYFAERLYTRCLGISKRIYQTHSFTHEPRKKLAYFILEEHNERSYSFLPGFDFYVLVFCYYDDDKNVTRVDVQYDQMSFFLNCMGLAQAHLGLVGKITPVVLCWAKLFHATGLVSPFTFLLNLLIVPVALIYWYLWSEKE